MLLACTALYMHIYVHEIVLTYDLVRIISVQSFSQFLNSVVRMLVHRRKPMVVASVLRRCCAKPTYRMPKFAEYLTGS